MIRQLALVVFLVVSAVLLRAVPAEAQYMFLDFDGDGQYTVADQYGGFTRSDTSRVDLYVVTNETYPGIPGPACQEDGSGPGINGYMINLLASSASMSIVRIENRMAGMVALTPLLVLPYALSVSYGGSVMYPPGKYLLLSMDVAFTNGCPALDVVPASCFSPPGMVTAIWSDCIGNDMDSVLKMGGDWFTELGSIGCTDRPPQTPSVSCPGAVTAVVGEPVTFTVEVDAKSCYGVDGFFGDGLPAGASLSDLGPYVLGRAEVTFRWIPIAGQEGDHAVRFVARNNDYFNYGYRSGECTTTISVAPNNRQPTAVSGGPYSGMQGVPVQCDGSHSSDPDGDALGLAWQLGDGATATGVAPLHTYAAGGVFTIVLRATDPGGLSDLDSTTATIVRDIPVRVFTSESDDPTRLGRGKPSTCFQIEATDGSFTSDQIVPASVFLTYTDPVCGDLNAYTSGSKTATVGDTDKNGIPDYSACFSREAMQTLGVCMPKGTQTVRLELSGSLATGERIHGAIEHTFVSTGALAAAITPNPVSAGSILEFTTRRVGTVTVRLFDIRGRLAATLFEGAGVPAGTHQVTFARLDQSGIRLASGVYFVRVVAEHDGEEIQRVTVLR